MLEETKERLIAKTKERMGKRFDPDMPYAKATDILKKPSTANMK